MGMPGNDFEKTLITEGRLDLAPASARLGSSARLARLLGAGTAHVYADTADRDELGELTTAEDGSRIREIDGNTVNQPLARKVLDRYLGDGRMAATARRLRASRPELDGPALVPHLYAVLLGWIGSDVVATAAAGRAWEVSLQLHMRLAEDAPAAMRQGRQLRSMVPTAFVKVPFLPHAPGCFLIARNLEREGIPVNFTSTFSARQAVTAALLADVARTNIFMGRLSQGLEADLLGEHVALEAQRALRDLRRRTGVRTQLIVASMRQWQTFLRTAGCDVYTAPTPVLRDFLAQEIPPEAVTSQLETSYADRLGVPGAIERRLGGDRIARLWRVEPELLEFLIDYRKSAEFRELADGDRLRRRFEEAGFGDVFHAPTASEWTTMRAAKLPDLEAPATMRLALDTLYSLLADGDFQNVQDEIDAALVGSASV